MPPRRKRRTWQQTVVLLIAAVVVWAVREYGGFGTTNDPANDSGTVVAERRAPETTPRSTRTDSPPTTERRAPTARQRELDDRGAKRVAEAYANRESDFFVTVEAEVIRLLDDDTHGDQHQQFIVRLSNDQTLKIAHNIDLAPRVPLRMNDRVRLRGEYEWTEQGGVLHWTHHDPRGRKTGGWIKHNGKMYK